MTHIMNNKMIPIAVVLATAALLAMTATTPLAFAQDGGQMSEDDRGSNGDPRSNGDHKKSDGGDQESETNEKLKSEADCNFSGKGNTCLQVPINIEAVGDIGL
jgi:hypothetical protein